MEERIILEKRLLDRMTSTERFDFVHRVTIRKHHASGGCNVTHVVHSERHKAHLGAIESYGSRLTVESVALVYLKRGFREVP